MSRASRGSSRLDRRGELFSGSNRRLPPPIEVLHDNLVRDNLFVLPHSQFINTSPLTRLPEVFYPSAKRVAPHAKLTFGNPYLSQLAMRVPRHVLFCVRRKSRREVLFAYRRAGFSGSAPRRYRRTAESRYSC